MSLRDDACNINEIDKQFDKLCPWKMFSLEDSYNKVKAQGKDDYLSLVLAANRIPLLSKPISNVKDETNERILKNLDHDFVTPDEIATYYMISYEALLDMLEKTEFTLTQELVEHLENQQKIYDALSSTIGKLELVNEGTTYHMDLKEISTSFNIPFAELCSRLAKSKNEISVNEAIEDYYKSVYKRRLLKAAKMTLNIEDCESFNISDFDKLVKLANKFAKTLALAATDDKYIHVSGSELFYILLVFYARENNYDLPEASLEDRDFINSTLARVRNGGYLTSAEVNTMLLIAKQKSLTKMEATEVYNALHKYCKNINLDNICASECGNYIKINSDSFFFVRKKIKDIQIYGSWDFMTTKLGNYKFKKFFTPYIMSDFEDEFEYITSEAPDDISSAITQSFAELGTLTVEYKTPKAEEKPKTRIINFSGFRVK